MQRDVVGDGGAVGLRGLHVEAGLVEDQQAGAQFEAFLEVVGDHEDGHLVFVPQAQDQPVHVGADAGVEGAEGFVQQQYLRLLDDGLGDGQALLHAAG